MAIVGNPNFETSHEESLDFDLHGKRKIGDVIQEIDSGVAKAAKAAKETRKVSEFTDTYGLLDLYKTEFIFEMEGFDPTVEFFQSLDEVDMEEMEKAPFDLDTICKYITQVRNSGGFDVDVDIPYWMRMNSAMCDFIRVQMSLPNERDYVYKLAKVAIDEINVDMNTNTKTFELVEVVNAVTASFCYALMYLTMSVNKVGEAATLTIQAIVCYEGLPAELQQWRFKPIPAPTPAPALMG